jgi:hypothetical protein
MFSGLLDPHLDPLMLVRGTDTKDLDPHRIRTKMSRTHHTAGNSTPAGTERQRDAV